MRTPGWESTTVDRLVVGDRARLASGVELTVSRIDRSFFGRPGMVKIVEATDERWLAHAAPTTAPVQVLRVAG